MADLNKIFHIISQSKPLLSQQEWIQLVVLQKTMHTKWLTVKEMSEEKLTMPPKYHCIDHAIAFCILWELTLGYSDEGGLEKCHQICNNLTKKNSF